MNIGLFGKKDEIGSNVQFCIYLNVCEILEVFLTWFSQPKCKVSCYSRNTLAQKNNLESYTQ